MRTILLAGIVLTLLATARAQSFNVDLGTSPAHSPVPDASYGGSVGQVGVWNAPQAPATSPTALPASLLVDLAGGPTPVTIASSSFSYQYDSAAGNAGFAALLGDWFEIDSAVFQLQVDGLATGDYEVTTYASVVDCTPAATRVTVTGSSEGALVTTGSYMNDHAAGVTYVRHRVSIAGGPLVIEVASTVASCFSELGACNGLQITRLDGGSNAICAGDGSGSACPCGNTGGVGRGCANSFDASGALLVGSGTASVAGDTLVLTASSVSNSSITFFQGTQAVNGSAGAAFGDGLRCASGTTVRIASQLASGNVAAYPSGPSQASISVRGAIPSVGGTRIYQAWYRNSASFCTPATFNLTNAVRTTWRP